MNDSTPKTFETQGLLRQTLIVWLSTMLAIRLIHELSRVPVFREYVMLGTALTLIYVPVWILWRRKERVDFFETSFIQLLSSLGWFLLLAVAIFPLVEIANRFYQGRFFHLHYVGGNYRGLANTALFQLLLVALPEEFFFRGYMQVQLNRIWPKKWRLLGVPIGRSLFVTSLIFAFSHSLIHQQWWHFSIFFPALAFGWLREKTGAITASVLFHALCNIYSYWVMLNYKL